MTKQEIQALIDAKIAGQGSAVDVGGALPAILSGILELAASGANVQSDWNQSDNKEPDYIKNKPSIPSPYTLPKASAETLGGIKVGENLNIAEDGTLSAAGGGGSIETVTCDYDTEQHKWVPNDVTYASIKEAVRQGKIVQLWNGLSGDDYGSAIVLTISPEDGDSMYAICNGNVTLIEETAE